MKNIDEAIKHAEEKAKELYCKADEDFFFDGDWGKRIECLECAKEHEQLANWLNELKRHSWIPVTERLPEINVEVIVTDIETIGTYASWYLGEGFWECDNGKFNNRIIAWMPLPEPYTKEEQDDQS